MIRKILSLGFAFLLFFSSLILVAPKAFAFEQSGETVTAISTNPMQVSFTPLNTGSGFCAGFTRAQLWWNGNSNSFQDFITSTPPNSSYPVTWLDAVSCSMSGDIVTLTYNSTPETIGSTYYILEYSVNGNQYFTNFFTFFNTGISFNGLIEGGINTGDTFSLNGSFDDTTENATSWTATVDYGDGAGQQALALSGTNFSLSHQYNTEGIYAVTIIVTNNQNVNGTASLDVKVGFPPQISTLNGDSILQGQVYQENGYFTDSDSASWTATVDYGDGGDPQPLALDGFNFILNHQYNSDGTFPVTVRITDNHGRTGIRSTNVVVSIPPDYEVSGETITPLSSDPMKFSFTPLHTSSGVCEGLARAQLWWNGNSNSFEDFITSTPPNSSYPMTWLDAVECSVSNGVLTLTYNRSSSEIGSTYYILEYTVNGAKYFTNLFSFSSITTTLHPTADSYIKKGSQNENEGSSTFMRLQSSGHNRALIKFDESQIQAAIGSSQTYAVKLRLTITDNGNNWGNNGRTIQLHRLLSNWAEGNGFIVGNNPSNKGTGSGSTWNCAVDTNISNSNDECSGVSSWNMDNSSLWPFVSSPSATQTIQNNQLGIVEFDVTQDVQAFLNGAQNHGWVIKKTDEGQNGRVEFGTKESSYIPELIITTQ